MWHFHEYEIVRSERFDECLSNFKDLTIENFIAAELIQRGIITVAKCIHCGKVKHIKTTI